MDWVGSHSIILMDRSPSGLSLQLPRVRLVHFGRGCLSSPTFHTPGMPSSCPPPGAAAFLPCPARLEPSTGASYTEGQLLTLKCIPNSCRLEISVGARAILTLPALASHVPSVLSFFHTPLQGLSAPAPNRAASGAPPLSSARAPASLHPPLTSVDPDPP